MRDHSPIIVDGDDVAWPPRSDPHRRCDRRPRLPGTPPSPRCLAVSRGVWLSLTAAMLLTAMLSVVAFLPAWENGFVYHDDSAILRNPQVNKAGAWHRFWSEPIRPGGASPTYRYRPLTQLSFRLNTFLAPGNAPDPQAFRLVNLGLHALTGMGVILLTWRLTRRTTAAWIAGVLFAVHPIHTEAVVTGYGRGALLAACFSVWLLVRYVPERERTSLRAGLFHIVNALLLLAAVMSDVHALFVWPMLILIDVHHRRQKPEDKRPPKRNWLKSTLIPAHVGFAFACLSFVALRVWFFGWTPGADPSRVPAWEAPLAHAGLVEHLFTPFRLLWLTVELCVWPGQLSPIWSIPALSLADSFAPDVVAGMLTLALLIFLTVRFWILRHWAASILAGLVILLILPVRAIPLADTLFSERSLYLPSVLVAVLVGAGLARLGDIATAAGLAAALVLLPATWSYGPVFADDLTLAGEVVRRQPANFQGRRLQALTLLNRDRHAAAIDAANEMLDRFEPSREAYEVLVKSYLALGDGERAREALDQLERFTDDEAAPGLHAHRKQAEALIDQQREARIATRRNLSAQEDESP